MSLPSVLKFSLQEEVEECAMGKKVVIAKGKGLRVRSDDVAMSGVIESTEGL